MSIVTAEKTDLEILRSDPVWVIEQVLGVHIYEAQRQIVRALWGLTTSRRRVAVKAAHSVGKSFLAGCCAASWLVMFEKAVVLTTAPTHRQVEDILWREIRARYRDALFTLSPKPPNTVDWEISPDRFAKGFATDKGEKFQGYHSPNVLIIVDEASGIKDEIFEAIEGILLGGANVHILLIGNPTQDNGEFYDAFYGDAAEVYEQFTLDAYSTPLFTGEDPEIDWLGLGLINPAAVAELERKYRNFPNVLKVRIHGEFPDAIDNQVISRALIRGSYGATRPTGVRTAALDVGAGGDATTFALLDGSRLAVIEETASGTTDQTVEWAKQQFLAHRPSKLIVDANGVGKGVYDYLALAGLPVAPFYAQGQPADSRRFANRGSEGWWTLREWMEQLNISLEREHPLSRQLETELTGAMYEIKPRGGYELIQVDKDAVTGKSPNLADALVMLVADRVRATTLSYRTGASVQTGIGGWAGSSGRAKKKYSKAVEHIITRPGIPPRRPSTIEHDLAEWSYEEV